MRYLIVMVTCLAASLNGSAVFAQQAPSSVRSLACTINPGYTMADVVATARAFEWPDEISPGLAVFRSTVARTRPANATLDVDFIADYVYPSYSDMVEKVGARLSRQAETDGRRALDGVATCSENLFMRTGLQAARAAGTTAPLTAIVTTNCELNGATQADVVEAATRFGENIGANSIVLGSAFGGPARPLGSNAQMLFAFPSFAAFGSAWDQVVQTAPTRDPKNAMTCSVPSLWAGYRVHPFDN
ncbi:MAG: hypothetical protein VX453_01190 [Acidobacteriota bacterium]|nr:hypothetical protein [Acidobacteriota bacterium]